ncbi:hypothetical protein ABAC460_20255 [Asticcacaulis sp. AC460]|uniref:hypothetical protein n=1 Tax=Asticcacaulis sp. AC460 TaxID=1282360 RepID=UPI0003C3DD3C|nr:hypothetical protein [Asticcacaulis sp. AC460]ESQ87359.1 hypothetical protein ABAC460_20255 [Asticcacaulis sp. AC460]
MRRLSIVTAIAVVAIVTGCATAEGYRQRLDLMAGTHSDQLQVDWGPPDRVSPLSNGNEMWVYTKTQVHHSGNSYSQVATGSYQEHYTDKHGKKKTRTVTTYEPVWVPPETWETQCETRFVIGPDQKVISSGFEGPDCVAEEAKPRSSGRDDGR